VSDSPQTLSVVLPVFNAARFIDHTLASLAAQDYEPMEVILVDDGSTDGSGQICRNWAAKDPRIKVVRQKNGGISQARNRGIRETSGQFLYFMDHDDLLRRRALSTAMFHLRHANAGVVKFGIRYTVVRSRGREVSRDLSPSFMVLSRGQIGDAYCTLRSIGVFNYIWNMVTDRRIIVEAMGDEPFDARFTVGGEDADFNFRLLQQLRSCAFIPDVLYEHFRRDGQSAVLRSDPSRLRNVTLLATRELEATRSLGCSTRTMAVVSVNYAASMVLATESLDRSGGRAVAEGKRVLSMYDAPRGIGWWHVIMLTPRYAFLALLSRVGWKPALRLVWRLRAWWAAR
jgi:glycosyltransferase involved in cell wall biosynthesis